MHTGVNNHGQSIRALQNGRILGGRGESAIPFLHVRDATDFVLRLLERLDDLSADPLELNNIASQHYYEIVIPMARDWHQWAVAGPANLRADAREHRGEHRCRIARYRVVIDSLHRILVSLGRHGNLACDAGHGQQPDQQQVLDPLAGMGLPPTKRRPKNWGPRLCMRNTVIPRVRILRLRFRD